MFVKKILIIFIYKLCNEKFVLNNKLHRYIKQSRHQFKSTNLVVAFQNNIIENRLIVKFIAFINVDLDYNFRS